MMDEMLERHSTSSRVVKALEFGLFDLVASTALQVEISKNKTLQLNVELRQGGGSVLHLTSHILI